MTGSLNSNRSGATGMLLTNGLVLIAGPDSSAELYDPATELWTPAASMHNQRNAFPEVLLPNGKVLAAGGFYFTSLTNAELYSSSVATSPIVVTNGTRLSGGAVRFGFTNTSGANFTALATTNLSLSVSNWSVIGAVSEISSGVFQFTDPQATNYPQRFYRVRSP
jgi:hypothetical protein